MSRRQVGNICGSPHLKVSCYFHLVSTEWPPQKDSKHGSGARARYCFCFFQTLISSLLFHFVPFSTIILFFVFSVCFIINPSYFRPASHTHILTVALPAFLVGGFPQSFFSFHYFLFIQEGLDCDGVPQDGGTEPALMEWLGSVLVSPDCGNKSPHTGGLKQQPCIPLQSWRPRPKSRCWQALGKFHPLLSSGCQHSSRCLTPVCLCLYMAFSSSLHARMSIIV